MRNRFHQGKFTPTNPKKYKGNVNKIFYRSSWEKSLLIFFDTTASILEYSSEEVIVIYRSPLDRKKHRYFVDFLIKTKRRDGTIGMVLIEVKPYQKTLPPVKKNKKQKTYLYESKEYIINTAKWDAAEKYCNNKGWEFQIITEKNVRFFK